MMFKIGDNVWDIMRQEWGVVTEIEDVGMFPMRVDFCSSLSFDCYTLDGKTLGSHTASSLAFKEFTFPLDLLERPRWRAEKAESYYTITAYGDVDSRVENFDEYDNNLFRAKNYFQTKEEAEESKIYKAFHEEV